MPRITEMWAYVVADSGPDDEGVLAMTLPNGMTFPLVGADAERMRSLRPQAEAIARLAERELVVLRFGVREDVTETFK